MRKLLLVTIILFFSSTAQAYTLVYDSGRPETQDILNVLGQTQGVDYDLIGGATFSALTTAQIQAYDVVLTGSALSAGDAASH